jgi:hypothetical protein
MPFSEIAGSEQEPELKPFEIEPRIFCSPENGTCVLTEEHLTWVRENWVQAGRLLVQEPKFYTAFKAFDSATVRGRTSASLLALWGAIEQLFAPSAGELRFRVAALLSSYLEPIGVARLELYKRILRLYNDRSTAAHTAKQTQVEPLAQTYVIMRNALVCMIDKRKTPTQGDLETLLFCGDSVEQRRTRRNRR